MMVQHRDGRLIWGAAACGGRAQVSIDLPAGLAAQPSELYDRVLAFACEVLGVEHAELRGASAPDRGAQRQAIRWER